MALTESENLFIQLCDACGITAHRIAVGETRSPDFELLVPSGRVVVEIKQFDPNPEERKAAERIARGEKLALGSTPGDRIRKAIHSSRPQLDRWARALIPALLVVYNATPCTLHTDPYAIATAMDGLDVFDVTLQSDHNLRPTMSKPRSGPKKKLTPIDNTAISAIGVLYAMDNGPNLRIFHNRFARHPIPVHWMEHSRISHCARPANCGSSLEAWIALTGAPDAGK